ARGRRAGRAQRARAGGDHRRTRPPAGRAGGPVAAARRVAHAHVRTARRAARPAARQLHRRRSRAAETVAGPGPARRRRPRAYLPALPATPARRTHRRAGRGAVRAGGARARGARTPGRARTHARGPAQPDGRARTRPQGARRGAGRPGGALPRPQPARAGAGPRRACARTAAGATARGRGAGGGGAGRGRTPRAAALGRDARAPERLLARLREAAARAGAARAEAARRQAPAGTAPRAPAQVARTTPPQVGGLGWPLSGALLAGYGARMPDGRNSQGVLIGAAAGTPVRAVADGTVVFAEWMTGYGMILIIDHGDGTMSLYAHCDSLLREPGARVSRGDTVATVGNSGGQGQPALYFELRRDGKPVNPAGFLQRR